MKQEYYYLYKISCLLPDKPYYYYGVHRTRNLRDGYFGSGVKLLACIKGLGKKNFKKEILHYGQTYGEVLDLERVVVGNLYETDPWCLNLISGGQGAREVSLETRRKMSISRKGKPSWNSGKTNCFHHTEETKQILKEKFTGKNSPVYGLKRKPLSPEVKASLSEKFSGKGNLHFGKPHSEETKKKIGKKSVGRFDSYKQKLYIKIVCPFCGKEVSKNNLKSHLKAKHETL